jgi:hypothetical protein
MLADNHFRQHGSCFEEHAEGRETEYEDVGKEYKNVT